MSDLTDPWPAWWVASAWALSMNGVVAPFCWARMTKTLCGPRVDTESGVMSGVGSIGWVQLRTPKQLAVNQSVLNTPVRAVIVGLCLKKPPRAEVCVLVDDGVLDLAFREVGPKAQDVA